jgi:hypothetical protein
MDDKNKQKILSELAQFRGTENYFVHRMFGVGQIYLTEGVAYLRQSCSCLWLMDIILSAQRMQPTLAGQEFQVWELKKLNGESWVITCTDGYGDEDENLLYMQNTPFSTFPLHSIVIWKDSEGCFCRVSTELIL